MMPGTSPNAMGPAGDPARVPIDLLRRYDRPGPRYTSYPTAVEFHEGFDEGAYRERLADAARDASAALSLYIHLPFCTERCTFCGCMVVITQKPEVSAKYLGYLHRELEMLASALGNRRRLLQYHWGGGTPTYLSVKQMADLHDTVVRHFTLQPGAEVAIEIDPRVTSVEQLRLLRDMGFNRLSLGVQDFTPDVQVAVNRVQSEAETRAIFEEARRLGFGSINIDLIYGLPLQTRTSFSQTIDTVVDMRPDRVAVYLVRARAMDSRPPEAARHGCDSDGRPQAGALRGSDDAVSGGRVPPDRDGSFRAPRQRAGARRGPPRIASELHGLHDAPGV